MRDQTSTQAAILKVRDDAYIEQMALSLDDRQDAVPNELSIPRYYPAIISCLQAVRENSPAPGM
jgi:hypothetical protein